MTKSRYYVRTILLRQLTNGLKFILGKIIGLWHSIHRVLFFSKKYEQVIVNLRREVNFLRENVEKLQAVNNNDKITYQSQKELIKQVIVKQREQSNSLYTCLNSLEQLHKTPDAAFSKTNNTALKSCIVSAHSLAQGIFEQKNEEVNLSLIMQKSKSYFASQIHKNNLNVQVICPENLYITGDPVYLEFILANFIGKAIYRLPECGKMQVLVEPNEDLIECRIQDNGFYSAGRFDYLIEKKSGLFLRETHLHHICYYGGLQMHSVKETSASNISRLTLPKVGKTLIYGDLTLSNNCEEKTLSYH